MKIFKNIRKFIFSGARVLGSQIYEKNFQRKEKIYSILVRGANFIDKISQIRLKISLWSLERGP